MKKKDSLFSVGKILKIKFKTRIEEVYFFKKKDQEVKYLLSRS